MRVLAIPSTVSFGSRRRSLAAILLLAVATVATAVRAIEMPVTPLSALRFLMSLAGLAFVYFAPSHTLARRALIVLACEALFGTLVCVLVDIPFIFDHQREIGTFVLSVAQNVDRLERDARSLR